MYYFYNITTAQEVTGSNPGWTNTQGLKITDPSGVVQPFMGRVGNEGVESLWRIQ